MPTYRDLGKSLHVTQELLRPSRTLPSTLTSLASSDRREFLTLSSRLAARLDELTAHLSEDEEVPIEEPFEELFAKLGYFRAALRQTDYAPFLKNEIRDLIQTTSRVLREPGRPSFRKEGWSFAESGAERVLGLSRESRERDTAPQAVPPKPRRPARYANAVLFEEEGDRWLDREKAIAPGRVFRLRLDIGELSRESQVDDPDAFPDHALPDEDVWIHVMVSSTHFAVGESGSVPGRSRVAHGRFLLPKDGGPARVPEGGRYLLFVLRAPDAPHPGARARVGYYFRGAIVQSQVLVGDVGDGPGGFRISTDFTVSENPSDLGAIRERPRVSLFANSDGTGAHQVSIRVPGSGDSPVGTGFELDEATVGGLVGDMRNLLRREDIAPTSRKRPRAKLIADLRALAPHGWKLWSAVPGQFLDAWEALDRDPEHAVLQVARSRVSSFTFPWTFIYEYSLDSEIPPEKLSICPIVDRWDGRSPLFQGSPRKCPEETSVPHENILCPFGFWGFRYSLEQITSTDKPVSEVKVSTPSQVVVAETRYGVDARMLTNHVKELETLLQAAFPGMELMEGKDKQTLRRLLGSDLPLVYFYCHGERVNSSDPNTYLGIGNREQITASDFIGWIRSWRKEGKRVWNNVRPLVFINACHSLEINPDTLVSYLDAFVGTARAAGVIGTEVKVSQNLAMEFAIAFFRYLTQDNWTVDRALRQVRLDFLRDGNLFGLLYTPYCWADLTLRRS
ncbi:MAG TPA: CHAT domain-containing protein [Longimicrobiaceae bacterium]|nr:CHAT domain-containing protein [Longimicrobiaceae bacterium]